MSEQKKSTIFYFEWNKLIKMLPDDKKLILYETILSESPQRPEDEQAACIFDFINDKLDENFDKYQLIRQKRKEAAEKRWGKNKKSDDKKSTLTEKQLEEKLKKSKVNLNKAVESMNRHLIETITLSENETMINLEHNDCIAIEDIIKQNAKEIDVTDLQAVENAYKALRDHLIKENHIYSTTYKNTGKRVLSEETKEKHEAQIAKKFYESFWDKYKDKVITVHGIELDCNYDEEMFFLKDTMQTSDMTNAQILEYMFANQ